METPLDKLIDACEYYGLEHAKKRMAECVAQGVDISQANKRGTALAVACKRRNLDLVEYLLECGADVNVHGQYGWTALHRAIHDSQNRAINLDIVRLLLAHGADVMAGDDNGETALVTAIRAEFNRELVEMLIDAGGDITAPTKEGRLTPLHWACWHTNYEAAEFLLARGVDVDPRSATGETPLRLAAVSRYGFNLPLLELLLQHGADPNSVDDKGNSIVWMHVQGDKLNVKVLRLLLNYGLDIRAANTPERSLLHEIASSRWTRSEALDLLLERGFPINALNKAGDTPLHVVCSSKWHSVDNLEWLLSRGAQDALVVENVDGYLPLHCAARWTTSMKPETDAEFLGLVLKHGADVHAPTRDGLSAMSLLLSCSIGAQEGQLSVTGQAVYDCVRLLCLHGATWDDSCERRLKLLEQIVAASADGEAQDSTGDDEVEKDSLFEQVRAVVMKREELGDAIVPPLPWLSGMRACIRHWTQERLRGGKDAELTDIPSEVLVQGEASVNAWIKDIQGSTAAQRVSRSKICVVGPSEWGKTSLVKSLTLREPSLVHVDDRTVGIDLFSCTFQEEAKQKEEVVTDGPSEEDQGVTVSDTVASEPKNHEVTFWDFAGQDVYQAAHALFFSSRTLYLLCVDLQRYVAQLSAAQQLSDRECDVAMRRYANVNVFKWVETILARQPDAEFVLVATKADTVENEKQIKAVWVDLQIRLGVWREEYATSAVQASGSSRHAPSPSREELVDKLTRAIHGQWLVVSSVDEEVVEKAREIVEKTVVACKKGFVMGNKYSRVLQAILDRRASAAAASPSQSTTATETQDAEQSRVEKLIVPSSRLIRDLCMELEELELEPTECVVILRTLHQLGDILWYEHRSAGALRDCVVLDPLLVLDMVREVVSHEVGRFEGETVVKSSAGDLTETVSDDVRREGRLTHALLRERPLWRHLDAELTAAFKSLLQYFHLAYPAGDREMAHDSDIIVPAYWKLSEVSASDAPLPSILQVAPGQHVYLAWEYVVSSAVAPTLFDQFAVQSYSPIFERTISRRTITSTENGGDFVSRILVTATDAKSDAIRIETAATDVDAAWLKLRFFVMMMEQVLEEYGGLYVMREVVEIDSKSNNETRHRVSSAVHDIETYAKMGKDSSELLAQRPWLPTDLLSWFVEKAWRHPGRLQEIQSRAFVRRMLDQASVLHKLVVRGEQGRLYPSLWTAQYDEVTKTLRVQMLSDLSGVCYHAPIEVSVPSQLWAKYGTAIESGLWVVSNVIPEILTLGLVQKVVDAAAPVVSGSTQRAQTVHSLIERLDLSSQGVKTTATSTALSPSSTRALLRDLLTLYDPSFNEQRVGELSNLQCAVSPSGSYVWAHPHEIKAMGGDKLTPCEPDYSAVVLQSRQAFEKLSEKPEQDDDEKKTKKDETKTQVKLMLTFEGLEGVSAWDSHKVFCSWRLVHESHVAPLAVGSTDPNGYKQSDAAATARTGALVTWSSRTFEVSVATVAMLRECRLEVQVKRASRLLGRVKDLGQCSQPLGNVVAADAEALASTRVEIPLEIAGSKAAVQCTMAVETVSA